jgi:hypothetical protein
MTRTARANGEPGAVALCSTHDAARSLAERVRTCEPTSLAVHLAVDHGLGIVRATGPVDALLATMADGADLGLHQTASRPLLRHRRTWELGTATPGVSMVYLTRARPGMSADDYHRYWEREHGPRALRHHLGMWDYTQVSVLRTIRGDEVNGVAVTQWARPEDLTDRFTDGPIGTSVIRHDAAQFTHVDALNRHLMVEHVWVDHALPASGPVVITDARSVEFDCPAEVAWGVLGRFDAILDWWPSGGFTGCETHSDERVGMTRTLTRQDGSLVVERLIDHRPVERMLHLTIDEGLPAAVREYTCRYEIRPVSADRCRLDWSPRAVVDAEAVAVFGAIVDRGWPMVSNGLTAAVSAR